MRTARAFTVCWSLLPGGGVPGPWGVYLVLGGVPGPGGVPGSGGGCTWSRGCTWSGGVYLVPGVYLVRYSPPVDRMTHAYENITLPQTSFAGGKNWMKR